MSFTNHHILFFYGHNIPPSSVLSSDVNPSGEEGLTFMVMFVFSGVRLPNHGPHWFQAPKQSLQKPPAPWLEPNVLWWSPDSAGLWAVPRLGPTAATAATAALAGLMFVEFQHAVVKVGWGSITGTGAAAARTPLSAGVDGQHVTEDTLRGGQVRLRGASRGVSIESSIGRFWDGGAEAWQGRGRGVGLMDTGPTHQGVPQHGRWGRMEGGGENLRSMRTNRLEKQFWCRSFHSFLLVSHLSRLNHL